MRLLVLVIAMGLTASAVLELRHRRLEVLHAMAVLHTDMDRHRRAAWELQNRISEATSPAALQAALRPHHRVEEAAGGEQDAGPAAGDDGFEPIPQAGAPTR